MISKLIISVRFMVIVIFSLTVVLKETACAASWEELICETGDYIPTFMQGVWGSSSTDVFFVGGAGYILHYDGQSCYPVVDNHLADIDTLYSVWGSSSQDVFAVGGNYVQILHFDGNEWSIMKSSKVAQNLYGVWGYSPNDVFAVGDGGIILRYDGESWSKMESGTTRTLYAIWGNSKDNIYAAGQAGTLLHFDGMNWASIYLGSVSTTLYDIWGSSSDDVYIVGNSGRYVNQVTGIAYHCNSSGCSQLFLDFSLRGLYENGLLHGVWGSAPDDVYAVGGDFWGGDIIHYDGEHWTLVDSGIQSQLIDIWGTSAKDIYAVGFGYRIFHFSEPPIITTSSSSTTTGLTSTSTSPSTTTAYTSTTSTIINYPCPLELVYGVHAEETALLRYFRDTVLSKTPEGQELITLYYQWSPAIVRAMEEDEEFKNMIKEIVEAVLPILRSIRD